MQVSKRKNLYFSTDLAYITNKNSQKKTPNQTPTRTFTNTISDDYDDDDYY